MSKVAIVSDSNSGITQAEAKELGITVLPMPFFIDDKTLYEDIDLDQEGFYQLLTGDVNISTSMPLVGNLTDAWDELLKEYDEIVHIPMSSGLSGSCQTAMMLANDYDDKVEVVDNQRISITMRQSVLDALAMVEEGKTGTEIKEYLEADALNAPIYLMVDTLKYLKKGGRVTPAAAAIGEVLNIKPVLKQALKTMLKALENDKDNRLKGKKCIINGAYAGDEAVGAELEKVLKEAFPEFDIDIYALPMSISTHVGPGTMGIGVYSAYKM